MNLYSIYLIDLCDLLICLKYVLYTIILFKKIRI